MAAGGRSTSTGPGVARPAAGASGEIDIGPLPVLLNGCAAAGPTATADRPSQTPRQKGTAQAKAFRAAAPMAVAVRRVIPAFLAEIAANSSRRPVLRAFVRGRSL
jgi:hypothetical protein